ncbi:F0F1 ATP synthase subunit A [Caloranaerobacter ferrireducens]|uniref:F0F1 ATP synthase subunit A n=1 Tax=Caloranaerobacter ferrireducens TaxID=1323370 RepID=UPI000AB21E43|nr:F0F1 ATP synthase subunit A [Caloranaerobacter ferrireducens]
MKIEIALTLFGKEIFIPETIVNTWIIVILLTIFAIYVNRKIKNAKIDEKPSGLLNVIELLVEGVQSLVESTMGSDKLKFAPYIGTLALYLLVANLFGLLGFKPPTSDYNVTFSLAIITFVLTQYYGLKSKGLGGYIKGFFEPMPLLFPLNVIGEIANPISLSFRLFGNILSGVIIMGLIYGALGYASVVITPVFHAYFDVFAGVIQTFIFVMLTMVFISMAME